MTEFSYGQRVDVLVLDNESNYLLVQKTNYKDNQWGFPGGGIEEEIRDIKWVPYEKLKEYLVFKGQRENVESVIKEYKNSL